MIGRNAVIEYSSGSSIYVIGFAQGCTFDIGQDLIKEYALGSPRAAILAAGNQSFKLSIDKMWVSAAYAQLVLAGAPVNLIFAPAGTKTGVNNPKITIQNVILTAHSTKIDEKGIISEKVSGEGNNYVVSTF